MSWHQRVTHVLAPDQEEDDGEGRMAPWRRFTRLCPFGSAWRNATCRRSLESRISADSCAFALVRDSHSSSSETCKELCDEQDSSRTGRGLGREADRVRLLR